MKSRFINLSNTKLIVIFACLTVVNSALSKTLEYSFSSMQQSNSSNMMDTLKINLDALRKSNWTDKEFKQAELMVDFVQHLMNNHNFEYISEQYGDNSYVQHSRGIADGMDELIKYVRNSAKRFAEYTYDVKHIYVDGDYVTFHSHATIKKKHRGNDKKGFNIIDTWKIKDGKIVEHWDAIQPINGFMRFYVWLSGGKMKNSNGMF